MFAPQENKEPDAGRDDNEADHLRRVKSEQLLSRVATQEFDAKAPRPVKN